MEKIDLERQLFEGMIKYHKAFLAAEEILNKRLWKVECRNPTHFADHCFGMTLGQLNSQINRSAAWLRRYGDMTFEDFNAEMDAQISRKRG